MGHGVMSARVDSQAMHKINSDPVNIEIVTIKTKAARDQGTGPNGDLM